MRYKKLATLLAMMFFATQLFAQGKITGRVYDSKTGAHVEYATVAVLNAKDSSLATGTVTESNGSFAVKVGYGRYLIRVSFMGMRPFIIPVRWCLAINTSR